MKVIFYAAWTTILFVASLPVAAAQEEVRQVTIDYSDLDLASPNGVTALERRIKGAIRKVCGGPDFTLREKLQQRKCAKTAGSNAADDVANAASQAREHVWSPVSTDQVPKR